MRRTLVESNQSFQGASTSNALVLAEHLGAPPPMSHLTNAESYRRAVISLGIVDQQNEAKTNNKYHDPLCIASDGGGGYLMIAYGKIDWASGKPIALPLAAADLLRDQSADHGMTLIEQAMTRSGLKDEQFMASCSDGATAARQESAGTCKRAHERAQAAGLSKRKEQESLADTCCIHGKALEEVQGMAAGFGPQFFVDSLRLIWELSGAPIGSGGRPLEYRKYFSSPVRTKEGAMLPALPVQFFDQNLAKVAEP
jgi:hypothetical protein